MLLLNRNQLSINVAWCLKDLKLDLIMILESISQDACCLFAIRMRIRIEYVVVELHNSCLADCVKACKHACTLRGKV